ncbi:hypothetical protein L6452_33612 [Arctium lappa]|uniref:Uncharacterized protein n=1 Tax=Arctium lappa TaxID=4217 RepID=A0ACB8YF72_ARCLA|nr:hypothetical protein L6452_33612 [Arctium lappa]
MLAFFFLLLCAQLIPSTLALESIDKKVTTGLNEYSYKKDSVKRDDLVLSKASKGKGSYGGQNDRPPDTKKSKAVSMLAKAPAYISNVGIGAIIMSVVIYF